MTTRSFTVAGMHCSACEVLIHKKLSKIPGIKSVNVSRSHNLVTLTSKSSSKISANFLNQLFSTDGYSFSVNQSNNTTQDSVKNDPFTSLAIVLLFIIAFFILSQTGFSSLVSVGAQSSLPTFFLFGLLAGFSSCAALVGGIILSLSQQWLSAYNSTDSVIKKSEPHFLFNLGRVVGYGFFGAILGQVGNFFRLSPLVSASLVIGVSMFMIALGLQMIGVRALQNFQIRLPKSFTSKIADEANFTSRFAPLLMGALTFFLPCGFTITAQALALASGSPFQGSMIMALFALGTVPGLLAIGLGSVKLSSNPKLAKQFSLTAGLLVLFFAFFNINSQLSVLGLTNLGNFTPTTTTNSALPPMVNGRQVVKISATATGYLPSNIVLRALTPTRWEVTATNVSGCTNAIISRSLFDGRIDLVNGTTSVKEFTTPVAGSYRFSCWMGMISGTVEVVN
ncbi:sulfite exporter TauE/SafE family protein [Candidatus Shapirobacteria bacterium]|nr:sulfite exporter TauE/SafE family protein [Candidatus Shapirobacteria bacterium]